MPKMSQTDLLGTGLVRGYYPTLQLTTIHHMVGRH
jgi:hypothetical protein